MALRAEEFPQDFVQIVCPQINFKDIDSSTQDICSHIEG